MYRCDRYLQARREDLALVWELPCTGKPVKQALSPSRAMAHLDQLLLYHGLTYVDAFILEIPAMEGGEVSACPPHPKGDFVRWGNCWVNVERSGFASVWRASSYYGLRDRPFRVSEVNP